MKHATLFALDFSDPFLHNLNHLIERNFEQLGSKYEEVFIFVGHSCLGCSNEEVRRFRVSSWLIIFERSGYVLVDTNDQACKTLSCEGLLDPKP
jgi:hypothetical protein